jgi:uncharacterized protein
MTDRSTHAAALVAILLAAPLNATALDCPAMPQQSQRDIDVAVGVAIGRLGQASGPQLQTETRTVTNDLLRRLPRADRVYLEQMMYATYCSSLRDNAALSETERNTRIQMYNRELRATLNPANAQPASKVDPRDAARADLARLPVEYTPEAFINGAQDGKTAVVRLFLQAGIDPNVGDRRGFTALMHAAGRGDVPMMEMLLKAGAAVNARTRTGGGTALSWAAGDGQLAALRLLLKAGAAKNTLDGAFSTALRGAHVDAMRLLLDHGANARADDGDTAHTLTLIPQNRSALLPEILDILLQRGWPVDARTPSGETALMGAAFGDNLSLMASLVKAGADVNLHCECTGIRAGGYSALTMASARRNEGAVRLLLDAGAKVDAPSNDGTALMLATEERDVSLVKLLLSRGADPNNARNWAGDTALMYAALRSLELVQVLIAAGADVNARSKTGATALIHAAGSDQSVIVRTLLDAGAQLEAKTQRGRTALMFAVMSSSVAAARQLLERGARIDAVDEDHRSVTAHAAALKGEDRERLLALLGQKDAK